jgi:hypothetical protein
MEPTLDNVKRNALFYARRAFQNEAYLCDILCGCIGVACFFLYLHHVLTHTLVYADDWQKQYLVANHIVRFREFPLVGDELSVFFGLHVTSPVYYYLFGFVLWLHNSMLFAQVVWLSLSMLAIVCVYLVAKDLFSPLVGLFACALFGFSFAYVQQLGQPANISTGQALLYLSFVALVRSYKRKDFALLLWAIVAYCGASVIYGGGFGVLPVFAVGVALTLKSQQAPAKRYLGSLALAGFVLLAAYFPIILRAYHAHAPLIETGFAYRFVRSPRTFLKNVLAQTIDATDTLFLVVARGSKLPPLSDYSAFARQFLFGQALAPVRLFPRGEAASVVLIGLTIASVAAYFSLKASSWERRRHAGILVSGILGFLFTAAMFNFLYHATWHYMAILGLYCMLVAETVNGAFTRLQVPKSIQCVFGVSLIWCFAGGFVGMSMFTDRSARISSSLANAAGAAIVRETIALRQALSEPQFHPQIKAYENGNQFSKGNPYLWTYMENAFNERFVKLSTSVSDYGVSYYGYEPVGDDRYVFIVCTRQACPQDWRKGFSAHFRQYTIVKDVIANDAYDIVLAKRM